MESKKIRVLGLVLAIGLSGCASISEDECRLGDWYQIGLKDGRQGEKNKAANYSGDCAEYKVSVDLDAYNLGRDEGLKSYCNYDNGAFVGSLNQDYQHVCPAELSKDFLEGYLPHKEQAEAEADVARAESNLDYLRSELEEKELTEEARKQIKKRIRSQKDEVKSKKSDLAKSEYRLALHKIDRKLSEINLSLEQDDLSAAEKERLQSRRNTLLGQREELEDMYSVDSTIRNIKQLIDLFK